MGDANPTTTDTASTTIDDQLDKEFATTTSIVGSDTASDAPDGATLLPGIEFLGCGYDVFGGFADTASVKMNLFDFSDDTFVNQALQTQGLTAEQIASAFTSVPSQVRPLHRLAGAGRGVVDRGSGRPGPAAAGISDGTGSGGTTGEVKLVLFEIDAEFLFLFFGD
jgi:hypothetical protein